MFGNKVFKCLVVTHLGEKYRGKMKVHKSQLEELAIFVYNLKKKFIKGNFTPDEAFEFGGLCIKFADAKIIKIW